MPYDGDPNYLPQTGYPLKRLYEQLANLPSREMIVVLDSCFSGMGAAAFWPKGQAAGHDGAHNDASD